MVISIRTSGERHFLHHVKNFSLVDDVELTITFEEDHTYKCIEEIQAALGRDITIGNYHFRHKDIWGFYSNYDTDILAGIHGSRILIEGAQKEKDLYYEYF